jgi:hypothetical protein
MLVKRIEISVLQAGTKYPDYTYTKIADLEGKKRVNLWGIVNEFEPPKSLCLSKYLSHNFSTL